MRIICFAIILSVLAFASPAYANSPKAPAASAEENATKPFPRLNPTTAADGLLNKVDNLDLLGEPKSKIDDLFVEQYTSNEDLKPLLARMFSVADGYIGNVNKRMAEAQTAAKLCDRASYDAAKDRLITAYVKASLYLQRKMDNIDALTDASAEYEQTNSIAQAKRRWSLFWAGVHDTLTNREITPVIIEILDKNANSSRYYLLGQAYSQAYGDILKRMNNIIKTADYPQFRDCDEPVRGPTLEEADAALAEALAAQKAMDEVEADLAEQDKQFAKLKQEMDKLVGDASLPDVDGLNGNGPVEESSVEYSPPSNPSDTSPVPQRNPDGSFMFPQMPVPTGDVMIDIPNYPEIPDMSKLEEQIKNSPMGTYFNDPCGLDPKKVCNVLLPEFRTDCTRELKSFYQICKKAPTINSCEKRCEVNWQQGAHDQALAGLAKKHIRAVYGVSEGETDNDYEDKEAEIKENKKRIKQIEEDAKKRTVHIYINENTDLIIRHAGNKFNPKPPLRYAGTEGGGLRMHERNAIANLNTRNKQLRQEIDNLVDGVHDSNSWITMSQSKWTADPEKSDGRCTADQNDSNRDACLSTCAGDTPAAVQNICYSSFVPQLALPFGRPYLYPPGHSKSVPKQGIK